MSSSPENPPDPARPPDPEQGPEQGPEEAPEEATDPGTLARDARGTTAATVVGTGLRFVSGFFATRALGAAAFGTYTLARTLVTVLAQAGSLGLNPGVLAHLARARRAGDDARLGAVARAAWLLVAVASGLGALVAWTTAPTLAARVFDDPALEGALRGLALLVVAGAGGSVSLALLQGLGGVRAQAWIERVVVFAVTAAGLLLAWALDLGMAGVVAASVIGPAVGLALGVVLVLRRLPRTAPPPSPAPALPLADLALSSWPLMGASLLSLFVLWMDVVLMGVFRPSEEVGVYGACARLAPLILLVHEGVGPVFLARVGHLHAAGRWDAIAALYRRSAVWAVWWALFAGWTLVLFAPDLLALFGPEFVEGTRVLMLLALARVVWSATGMGGRLLMVTGRQRLHLVNAGVLLGMNVVLDVLWIPRFGAEGAAAATCVAIVVGGLLPLAQVWRLHRIHPWSRRTGVALLATAIPAACVFPWRAGPDVLLGWSVPFAVFAGISGLLAWRFGRGEGDGAA